MKDPQNLKDEVKFFAAQTGADLVGIAPVERFGAAPEGFRPTDLVAQAQAVIVMAKRIPRGIVENQSPTAYTTVTSDVMKRLDRMAYDLACFLEDQGGRALPVPADDPYTYWDEENRHGAGDLSHRHAAVAAGLGRLGKNSLLITPQFGNRVQLVSVITDLVIHPDPLIEEELCLPGCRRCLDACAAAALPGNQRAIQKPCREVMSKKLPRGFSVIGCWQCRRACSV